jgi:beta-galactosidase
LEVVSEAKSLKVLTQKYCLGRDADIDKNWRVLRKYQPKGPLVNAEYYPGWLSHWQENMSRVETEPTIRSFK